MRMASENPTRNPPFTGQSPAFAGNAGPARPEGAYRQGMDIVPATGDIGRPQGSQARTVFGLVLMLVGMLLLLDRLDWWGVQLNVPLWPWVLVLLGLARLGDRSPDENGCRRGSRGAVWLLFLGAWGLVNEYRLFGLHYGQSWPLLLIGAGALVVWRAMDPAPPAPVRREPNHG
jgi:hypothetical protein